MYGEVTDLDIIQQPQPGNNVKLTIDAEFQARANNVLKAQVEMLQTRQAGWGKECTGATMVVLDVKTAILPVRSH